MTSLSLTLPPSTPGATPAAPKVFLSSPLGVFLDSGGTLSMLPSSIVRPLAAAFPGAQNVGGGQYTVPCSAMNQTGFVDFGFGSKGTTEKVIRVPFKEFVWFVEPGLCALGLMEGGSGTNVLGDTFLRAAFVVYDQDNNNIHLAESADCGSNLVAIGKGADAVPSIVGACAAPAYSGYSQPSSPGLTTKAPGFTTSIVGKPTATATKQS